jgi:shikimate 5-dehydrogenase
LSRGYGGAGSSISYLLLQEIDCDIVVAGRLKAMALDLCDQMNVLARKKKLIARLS